MVYTEVASRDAKKGVIVISDTLEELCKDLLTWKKEMGSDDFLPAYVFEKESQEKIGKVTFRGEELLIEPA